MIRNSNNNDSKRPEQDEMSEEIRVTDRRRINLDRDGEINAVAHTEPNLKPSYVEELENRVKSAESKMLEVQTRFEQLRAQMQRETDETRQRLNRAAEERAQRQKADFIAALLPVLDNLHRAIEAGESHKTLESVLEGVKSTAASFESALAAVGVEPVTAVGEHFNPESHEAVDVVQVPADQDGVVTAEYARGYKLGDRLLRPARVQVGNAPGSANQTAG